MRGGSLFGEVMLGDRSGGLGRVKSGRRESLFKGKL